MTPARPPNFQHVVNIFGSLAELGRAVGVGRSAATRWANERVVPRDQQLAIIKAAIARGASGQEVAWALGVPRCSCCAAIIDDEIRQEVLRGT